MSAGDLGARPIPMTPSILLAALAALAHAPARPAPSQDPVPSPAVVGELAPSLGPVRWIATGSDARPWTADLVQAGLVPPPPRPGDVTDWRGRSVLVHALHVGEGLSDSVAPAVADVARANLDRDVAVVVLLVLPEDSDGIASEASDLADAALVAAADPRSCPYVRGLAPGEERLYVVSRTGLLVDEQPAEALELALGHLRASLFWPAAPALEGVRPPVLENAFARYEDGEWQRTRVIARRAANGLPEDDPLARRVAEVVAQVDAWEATCAERVQTFTPGDSAADLLPWVVLRRDLVRGFPGMPCTRELLLAMDTHATPELRQKVDRAAAWLAVEARRPIGFPQWHGDADAPFLQELRGTLQTLGDDPLAQVGRAWLARHETTRGHRRPGDGER